MTSLSVVEFRLDEFAVNSDHFCGNTVRHSAAFSMRVDNLMPIPSRLVANANALLIAAAGFVVAESACASSVLIDFNALPDGTMTSPLVYPMVSFSGGLALEADGGKICGFFISDCGRQLVVTFASPVSVVSFETMDEGSGYSAIEVGLTLTK